MPQIPQWFMVREKRQWIIENTARNPAFRRRRYEDLQQLKTTFEGMNSEQEGYAIMKEYVERFEGLIREAELLRVHLVMNCDEL